MSYELSGDIVHADRAWHDLEKRLHLEAGKPKSDFIGIVDFDVLLRGDNPVSFANRDEVRDKYEGFLTDPRLGDAPSAEFIGARLTGQLLHLDLLDGGRTNVFDHIETAMGSELALIDEGYIDSRQQAVEEQYAKLGLGFDPKYAEDFEEKLGIGRGKEAMTRYLAGFASRVGLQLIPEIVEEDASWVGYATTDEQGRAFAQINAHERHGYARAKAAATAVHEATGHMADFAYKRRATYRGSMDPLFGETTLVTRENVTAETVALGREWQVLYVIEGPDALEYHAQANYHDYLEMIWNNLLIRANTGDDEDELVEYAQSRSLPYEKEENIRGRIQEMRDDPLLRANSGAYGPAGRVASYVTKELSAGQQEKFFKEIVKYPYSEAQMWGLLEVSRQALAA